MQKTHVLRVFLLFITISTLIVGYSSPVKGNNRFLTTEEVKNISPTDKSDYIFNISLDSKDELLSTNSDNTNFVGLKSYTLSDPPTNNQLYYINAPSNNTYFDKNDIQLAVYPISDVHSRDLDGWYLNQFGFQHIIIDENKNSELDRFEPVFNDSDHDYRLSTADSFSKSGTSPLYHFNNTSQTEGYLDRPNFDSHIYNVGEPIFSLNNNQSLEPGGLSNGETQLLVNGMARIVGFGETSSSERVFDVDSDSSSNDIDSNEAIVDIGNSNYITSGLLSSGSERVVLSGKADLHKFLQNQTFYINCVGSSKNILDQGEVIIKDVQNVKSGQIDSEDRIIAGGFGNVHELQSGVASFLSGDLYIGNSNGDSVLQNGEYIFIESGTNIGFQRNSDIVISIYGDILPSNTDPVTQIKSNDITNVAFLDTNDNGILDVAGEAQQLPGSEPLVIFSNPRDIQTGAQLSVSDGILSAAASNPEYLDINGNWFEGDQYRDLNTTLGPKYQHHLGYSDGPDGVDGVYDSGELLFEEGNSPGILEPSDYVLFDTNIKNTELSKIGLSFEFIDVDGSGNLSEVDILIKSDSAGDDLLQRNDEIIKSGIGSFNTDWANNIEFIDVNGNSLLDPDEPIIKSTYPDDNFVNVTDGILRTQRNPGVVDIAPFDQDIVNEDGRMELFARKSPKTSTFSTGDAIVEVANYSNVNTDQITGQKLVKYNDSTGFVDIDSNRQFNIQDPIFREGDQDVVTPDSFGDGLSVITVRNTGTLSDDEIDRLTLYRNSTPIANATDPTGANWILDPRQGTADFGPTAPTDFHIAATLSANATPGETLTLTVPPVSDSGAVGIYDPGDTGVFFEQGDPKGSLGPGSTVTVSGSATPTTTSPGSEPNAPRPLSLDVEVPSKDVTAGVDPVPITITGDETGRVVEAALVPTSDRTPVANETRTLDETGAATVTFEPRPGRYRVRATDSLTGETVRSHPFRVLSPPAGATFGAESYSAARGAVAHLNVSLTNTDRATLRVSTPTGHPVDVVRLHGSPEGGRLSIALNTSRSGRGPPGHGFRIVSGDTATAAPGNRSGAGHSTTGHGRIRGIGRGSERSRAVPTPPVSRTGRNRSYPLAAGRYALELSVNGNLTDSATLRLSDDWGGTVRTFVAPRGTNVTTVRDLAGQVTGRSHIAVGDVVVVEIHPTGVDGFYTGVGSLRRGSAVARTSGAYAAFRSRSRKSSKGRGAPSLGRGHSRTLWDEANQTAYLVVDTDAADDFEAVVGQPMRAAFTLNESSPFVAGQWTEGVPEAESIGANFSFVEATAAFDNLDANGTLNFQAGVVSVSGTTTVAPGTNATVRVVSARTNESSATETTTVADSTATVATVIEAPTTVEDDGSYETTVDLSEFEGGTEYTVSVSANDERLSPIRSGHIVESGTTASAAAVGGGVGGGGFDSAAGSGNSTETTGPEQTTHSPSDPTGGDGGLSSPLDSIGSQVLPPVFRLPEGPVDLGGISLTVGRSTLAVIGLGLLALFVALLGVRRLI